jgi:carboxypeptidase C (cathepsin A)
MKMTRKIFSATSLLAAVALVGAVQPASAQGGRRGGGDETDQAQQGRRGGGAQQGAAQQPTQGQQTAARPAPPPEDRLSVTHHSARIGGQQMDYTATAGIYVLKADDGTPLASVFFVAYTKDGVQDITKRPVAFSYNGGPGSASLFVHMGFGPRRVVLTPDGHGMPAPYSIVDNKDSFLDATDIVFIDAISTGYSRPAPGENPNQFHGLNEDANTFANFIRLYITRNSRWASPKYLIGESYGTTRSAALSGALEQRYQIYLNGIVLVSAVLNFQTLRPAPGNDLPYLAYFPTFATTAWYHHLLSADMQKLSVEQIAQQAREFADGEYATALMKGDALSAAEHQKTVQQIARFTGLTPKYIEETDMRINPRRWFKELERDKRRTMGRLDSRFEGIDADAAGEAPEYDPSEASYEGAFAACFEDYLRRELKFETDAEMFVSGQVQPWNYPQNSYADVSETLRAAMSRQTYLKVLVVAGYYDVATAFHGVEFTVNHMGLEPAVRKNISFTYYESGHMVYIDEKAHAKLHKDVDEFINTSYTH